MTENRSSTLSSNHETLSKFHWVEALNAFGGGVYFRVGLYDADKGRLLLDDVDTGASDEWIYDGEKWVCDDLCTETPGDITETEFSGANRCRECGCMHNTDTPDDHYCGCG